MTAEDEIQNLLATYERSLNDSDAALAASCYPSAGMFMPTTLPTVRVRLSLSAIGPGDTKKRAGWPGSPMIYPRVIPHSDGAGVIDAAARWLRTGSENGSGCTALSRTVRSVLQLS